MKQWIKNLLPKRSSKRFSAQEVQDLLEDQFQITKYEMISILRKDIELPGWEAVSKVYELSLTTKGFKPLRYEERSKEILNLSK